MMVKYKLGYFISDKITFRKLHLGSFLFHIFWCTLFQTYVWCLGIAYFTSIVKIIFVILENDKNHI